MYTPSSNEEHRLPVLREMMAAHPLAALVTLCESGLVGSHIPMVHEDDGSEFGVLRGHVARANTQWKDASTTTDALAIFAGAQHYISAGWYPGKFDHGKEVPTWNYVVVHATGRLRIVHDSEWLTTHLVSLTDRHEAQFATPWKVSDAPPEFVASLLKAIVGIELPIRRLEGKWKVSQNRSERDRDAVAEALGRANTPEAETMRALVESRSRE